MGVTCPRCGTGNSEGSKFCRECAAPMTAPSPAPPSPGPAATGSGIPPAPLDVTLPSPAGGEPITAGAGASDELPPGTTFAGRFRIIEMLGRGGMGQVYKAVDTKIGEKVALKIIRPDIAAEPGVVARFADEIRLARRIAHPNVCRMFDMGEEGGAPFIAMEYVPGEELRNVIRMTPSLSAGQTAHIGKQVAAGLAEAHRLGIIHRDLKPQNIMIDRDGAARIMDFGLARLVRADAGRTGRGVMVGTPDYISPEQADGAEIDARSDLYSLGVVLFEMATGRVPFPAATPLAAAVKHTTEAPPDPRTVRPGIPDDLAELILRLLDKDPARRVQTAAEVRDALEGIERGAPTVVPIMSHRATSLTGRVIGKRPAARIMAAAGTVVLVAAAAVFGVRLLRRGGAAAAPKVPNSIVVVGFENRTGNARYDHLRKAIPELIITNLENMGRFQVTTWERMQDLLRLSGKGEVAIIGPEEGFDICRREGVAAIVTGGFTKAGEIFAVDAKLLDAGTRRLLTSASARGEGENSILLTQIDTLSGQIARGLVPAGTGARPGGPATPVTDVTTTSMDAYAAFLRGRDGYERYRYNEASRDLERAVAIDPSFATAHYYLARIYRNLGDLEGTVEHFEAARAHAAKATEKERLWIEAGYAGYVERNGEKRVAILREAVGKFPREKTVWLDLGNAFYGNRRYEQAVASYRKALELDPSYGGALNQLAYCYLEMGRHDDAAACLRTYQRYYPGDVNPVDSLAEVDYSRGRIAEAEAGYRKVAAADPTFGADRRLAWMQALQEKYDDALGTLRAWAAREANGAERSGALVLSGLILHLIGRDRESREAVRAGREAAAASGAAGTADLVDVWLGFDRGDGAGCRAALRRLTASGSGGDAARVVLPIDPGLVESLIDLAEGKTAMAEARWAAAEKARALEAKTEQLSEDDLRGLVDARLRVARGDLAGARALLARAGSVPLLFMNAADLVGYVCPLDRDDLARLDARRGDLDGAIAVYRTLTVIGPGHNNRRPVHPIYHYRLARLLEKKGLAADAAAEYGRFLKVLEKADAETAEMKDARARRAALAPRSK